MNLRAEILSDHSRRQHEHICDWIGADTDRFGQLMQLFLHDEYRVVQHAAHIVSLMAGRQPQLMAPYISVMLKRIKDGGIPVAVKRNVVRVMQFIDIPAHLHGDAMNLCFNLLEDVKETVAVRVFSMTVLFNLSGLYPEIKPELKMVIGDHLQHETTAGFQSRAKKVLAGLKQAD